MPKSAPPPRPSPWRANPYGTWISQEFAQESYRHRTTGTRFNGPPYGMQPQQVWGPPDLGSLELPYQEPPSRYGMSNSIEDGNRPQSFLPLPYCSKNTERSQEEPLERPAASTGDPGNAQPVQKAQSQKAEGPNAQSQQPERQTRPLTRVSSMVLQAVTRGSRRGKQIPDLRVISNSKGSDTQSNVYSKVPVVAKTISFNVDDEEALLKAYRHVKAMNPSVSVGGIMFCSGNNGAASDIDTISWKSISGRSGLGKQFSFESNGQKVNVIHRQS
ncbi:hypothetical protein FBEOM_5923 [Fusarium beomiforme]|uniref:Uncharacterized protein n=1 Tax=Fusarium beomiforme TaxID=44412 RepID=A0A9P5DWV7_9HYPO|nr:hypothetical protein FBEOM_5923 [Fusarium beomiforme]